MLRPIAMLVLCLLAPANASSDAGAASDSLPEATEALSLAPGDSRWVPLDVGNRWSYVFARERSRSTNRAAPVIERFRGARSDEVRPAEAAWGSQTVELRSVLQGRTEGKPTDSVERQREFVTFDGRSLRVLGREAVHPMGETAELVRFTPPLEAIRGTTSAGETWDVGTEHGSGIQTRLKGEILGIQDARTPAGLFEKCLVVKRVGNSSGRLQVYGSEIEVRGGTLTTTEWYAPGVGLVLAKHETEHTMALEDGSIVEFVEKTQFALNEVALTRPATTPSTAPAAPAPTSTDPELNPQIPVPSHADEAGDPGSAVTPSPTDPSAKMPSSASEAAATDPPAATPSAPADAPGMQGRDSAADAAAKAGAAPEGAAPTPESAASAAKSDPTEASATGDETVGDITPTATPVWGESAAGGPATAPATPGPGVPSTPGE